MHFHPYMLRPITADDGPELFRLIDTNRARLEDFFAGTVALTRTLGETEKHVMNMLAKADARTYFAFALVDERTGTMAGFVDIKNID
jgi:arginine/ornithine N-succinyltransferase beta subunit